MRSWQEHTSNLTSPTGRAADSATDRRTALVARDRIEMVMSELSHVLWQQRDLVTHLIYRLEVQQLVLASGDTRWIQASTSDVEDAIEDVQRQEHFREGLVSDLSPLLGTPSGASLRQLVEAAPTPWDTVLAEHHSEFLRLAAHAEETTRLNTEMLHGGLSDVSSLLGSIGATESDSYPGHGSGSRATSAPLHALLIDEDA